MFRLIEPKIMRTDFGQVQNKTCGLIIEKLVKYGVSRVIKDKVIEKDVELGTGP